MVGRGVGGILLKNGGQKVSKVLIVNIVDGTALDFKCDS